MVQNVASCIAFERACLAYNKGMSHLLTGNFESCILSLQECIFFSPNRSDANAMVVLGECYIMACDIASAVRWYRRALRALQNSPLCVEEPQECKSNSFTGSGPTNSLFAESDDNIAIQAVGSGVHGSFTSLNSSGFVEDKHVGSFGTQFGGRGVSSVGRELHTELTALAGQDLSRHGVSQVYVETRLAGLLDALGLLHYGMGDFPQALRFADQSLALLSNQPLTCLHRCMYLMVLQREDEAERELEKYLMEIKKSIETVTESIFSPYRAQIATLLVYLCCDRQGFKAARTLLEEELRGCGMCVRVGSDVTDEAQALYENHLSVVARQQFHETYSDYRTKALARQDLGTISRCINVYPDDFDLIFARAKINIRSGQLKRSVRDLFRCIKESNGTHSQAVEMMTSVLFTIGQSSLANERSCADPATASDDTQSKSNLDDAIVYYTESLKWRTQNTSVLLARGDCYSRKEDYLHALEDYRRILELEDKFGETLSPIACAANGRIASLHHLWGCKLYAIGSFKEAEIEFTNAIKADERQPLFFFHRALCRFRLKEPSYALRDVLSCNELKPTDAKLRAFIVRYLGSLDTVYSSLPLVNTMLPVPSLRSHSSIDSSVSAPQITKLNQRNSTPDSEAEVIFKNTNSKSCDSANKALLPPITQAHFNRDKYFESWRHYRQSRGIDPIAPGTFRERPDIVDRLDNDGYLRGKQLRLHSKKNSYL